MKLLNALKKLEIRLPQFTAVINGDIADIPPILIVLGGRAPSHDWFVSASKITSEVWAADSGGRVCVRSGISPARLIGDFDSIESADKSKLVSQGAAIEEFPKDKDMTDYQLCLQLAGKEKKSNVIVTGAWGGRFDHAQSNIYSALWARDWGVRVLCIADERETFFYLNDAESIEIIFNNHAKIVSLLPLDICEGVNVNGTKWTLNAEKLFPKKPYTISNTPIADKVRVNLRKGVLGVYLADSV